MIGSAQAGFINCPYAVANVPSSAKKPIITNQWAIPVAVKLSILVCEKTSTNMFFKRLPLLSKRVGSLCPAEIFLNNLNP